MQRWACLLVLAACGGSPEMSDDDEPETSVVTVRLTGSGAPAMGVTVIVQSDASGSDTTVLVTDVNGMASVTMDHDVLVTIIEPPAFADGLYDDAVDRFTFAGIQPGKLLDLAFGTAPASPISMPVTLPAYPGAEEYWIDTSCGGMALAGTTGTWSARTPCVGDMDVMLEAKRDDEIVATIWASGIEANEGHPIDLSDQTWQPFATRSYTAVHTGADWSYAPLVFLGAGGVGFTGEGQTLHDGATGTAQLPVAPDANNAVAIDYTDGPVSHSILAWGIADPFTVYESAAALAAITDPTCDAASCDYTLGAGAAPEGIRAAWAGPSEVAGHIVWYWIGASPDDGHVALPTLPAPNEQQLAAVESWMLVEETGPTGLAGIRTQYAQGNSIESAFALSPSGVIRAAYVSDGTPIP